MFLKKCMRVTLMQCLKLGHLYFFFLGRKTTVSLFETHKKLQIQIAYITYKKNLIYLWEFFVFKNYNFLLLHETNYNNMCNSNKYKCIHISEISYTIGTKSNKTQN